MEFGIDGIFDNGVLNKYEFRIFYYYLSFC